MDFLKKWSDKYEDAQMVPADDNKQLADSQLDTLLPKWPAKCRDLCRMMVVSLLVGRLQRLMMGVQRIVCALLGSSNSRYPKSPAMYHNVINGMLDGRKLLVRYFASPRPDFPREHWIRAGPDSHNERYVWFSYLAYPWYATLGAGSLDSWASWIQSTRRRRRQILSPRLHLR